MTNIYKGMTQQYKLSKTLRFELKPIGSTLDNIHMEGFLEKDKKRSEEYKEIKVLIDDYHRFFIDKSLSNFKLDNLKDYYKLYVKNDKTNVEIKEIKNTNALYRNKLEQNFKKQEEFEDIFKDKLFKKILPIFISKNENKYSKYNKLIDTFNHFSTYFIAFHENRKNIYTKDEISTSITYRIVNDNLPIFISNVKNFKNNCDVIKRIISESKDEKMCFDEIDTLFDMEYFNYTLSQKGIDEYNRIISGYSKENGNKVQGINEIINLYNQSKEKNKRLPEFIKLKKQILSDVGINGFDLEKYEDDIDLSESVSILHSTIIDNCFCNENSIEKVFETIEEYDLSRIYIKNGLLITNLSNEVYGSWDVIKNAYYNKFIHERCDNYEKFNAFYKEITYFNLKDLIETIDIYSEVNGNDILHKFKKFSNNGDNLLKCFVERFKDLEEALGEANHNKNFIKDDFVIQKFKLYLDSGKRIQNLINTFKVDEEITDKDELFYSYLKDVSSYINLINDVYNKARNYLTQKPYSSEKYKLNFERPTLLKGWDINKEKDNLSVIFKKDRKYYLGIINKNNPKLFLNIEDCDDEEYFEKMEYKLLPGPYRTLPHIYFVKKNKEIYKPSEYIVNGYNLGKYTKSNFDKKYMEDLIDFYKEKLNISHPMFAFKFKETKDYKDIGEFYNDVEQQAYTINYKKISSEQIYQMVYENKLYLFEIYNKDFSEYSKGNKNLHTMYWEAIFSEENKNNIIYKLDGEAELFYRPASLSLNNTTIHKANLPVLNKNENNNKKESLFTYDIIKNKRYTEDKFIFHVPLSFNFINKKNKNLNGLINYNIKHSDNVNVIGIDRGERNLLYVTVINSNGEILEQKSLNEIVNEYNGNTYKVDYHNLLDRKEKERREARESWKTINNIKELKEGYIGIVINKIVNLMDKYKAIVVLEDLNHGFMNSRVKVEKQIYQKFEKALIEKLNFLVLKDKDVNELGGLHNPYQLTNKFESFNKLGKQTGVIFYVPAQNTSKIDPVTGFINRLYPKYESVQKSIDFFEKFDDIRYNSDRDYFEFVLNYNKFIDGYKTKANWNICTFGKRLVNKRNSEKNNQWDTFEYDLTTELKDLFVKNRINYSDNLKEQILLMNNKDFFETLMYMLKLTLQFRNSKTGTMEDYIISPVTDGKGNIFVSGENEKLPVDADANGAYNIARKGLMCIRDIKNTEDSKLNKIKYHLSLEDFLNFVQNNE